MKGIIIFKGKYGATKQYAEWLSEETGFPAISADRFNESRLREFDTIILGTSVYIGKLQIRKWLRKNLYELRSKKLYLFLVAGTPPNEKEKLTGYINSNVPKELIDQLTFVFLPGKLIVSELSAWDRFLLRMGRKMAEKNDPSQPIQVDYNHVKKENLDQFLDQLRLRGSFHPVG